MEFSCGVRGEGTQVTGSCFRGRTNRPARRTLDADAAVLQNPTLFVPGSQSSTAGKRRQVRLEGGITVPAWRRERIIP